jgi:SAM-dependent methyltransferase
MTHKRDTHWYDSWFDTPYYHILYKDRDYEEAQLFMDRLTSYLNLPEEASILDLACGRGRHSIYLNELGFRVTGVDLSQNNIEYAREFQNEKLQFEVHDMSKAYPGTFDAVFNLFTSFGYFEEDRSNLDTIKAIKQELNDTGFAVIDFMNVPYVLDNLVEQERKVLDGIEFRLSRKFKDGYIEKDIRFIDKEQNFEFKERVKALTLRDFETLFEKADMHLLEVFGDYNLGSYDRSSSPRLIMIFK